MRCLPDPPGHEVLRLIGSLRPVDAEGQVALREAYLLRVLAVVNLVRVHPRIPLGRTGARRGGGVERGKGGQTKEELKWVQVVGGRVDTGFLAEGAVKWWVDGHTVPTGREDWSLSGCFEEKGLLAILRLKLVVVHVRGDACADDTRRAGTKTLREAQQQHSC